VHVFGLSFHPGQLASGRISPLLVGAGPKYGRGGFKITHTMTPERKYLQGKGIHLMRKYSHGGYFHHMMNVDSGGDDT